ncbi:hypothetical protein D9V84_00810 [Bacteroidetes/Chlorobi group bacterium Naka2016]|jgi:hypothetical protein|nr:MAG: hypothetical protein D9V84_00810 [Bacteroidetes/Chlorobi group bacterium Naka2016]
MVFVIILLVFSFFSSFAQVYMLPIDTVLYFKPGKGQNLGQDPVYFPKNIFTLPDTNASESIPSSSPKDVCSIGLGGEIVVGFKNYFLLDGDGPDFTIFENAFINPITKKVFAEPAVVSVSEDGVNFVEFPWDYNTLEGCAGTKPTNGKANPFDPTVSGGNSFDLATIGLNRVRWIKIKDICDTILQNPNHPFYDALISGFDLDCVVGLNLKPIEISNTNESKFPLYFVDNLSLRLNFDKSLSCEVYDILGRIVEKSINCTKNFQLDFSTFEGNVFFVNLRSGNDNIFLKILKMQDALLVQ